MFATYDTHGRIRHAHQEAAYARAAGEYLADFLAGKDTLLLAGTNAEAAELARIVQSKLSSTGKVGNPRIELADGNHAGTGDIVRARHGWGHLIFTDASPAAGRAYTDDGQGHEHRGLKGRTKGRPSPKARRPVRKVPIPPELVELLRAHVQTFGVAPDGRLFRSENGNLLQPSTWWQVWQKVRAASLTPEQQAIWRGS